MVFNSERKAVSGFTLVEMAIVLVIIGIILAGVMKGRDIVRGSQVKQFSQQFAQKWGTVAQTYYDKTGQQLNDGAANGGAAGVPDGLMDANVMSRAGNIVNACESVGITPCTMIKSKLTDWNGGSCSGDTNIAVTLVDGEYTGSTKVFADLVTLDINTTQNQYRRNTVVLYGVPSDVAKGLDTAVDGQEDGNSGSLFTVGNNSTPDNYTLGTGDDVNTTLFDSATEGDFETVVLVLDY